MSILAEAFATDKEQLQVIYNDFDTDLSFDGVSAPELIKIFRIRLSTGAITDKQFAFATMLIGLGVIFGTEKEEESEPSFN